jgi:hypothetical protein
MKTIVLTLLTLLSSHLLGQVQKGPDIADTRGRAGWSVAMSASGDTVAVGSPYVNGLGLNYGELRVYAWDGSDWVQIGDAIEGMNDDDRVGLNVSISNDGKRVAIGFSDESQRGFVQIYEWRSSWEQIGEIRTQTPEDAFGSSISLSGDGRYIAIGAPLYRPNGERSGRAEVYRDREFFWELVGEPIVGNDPDNWNLGRDVELNYNGTVLAVSDPLYGAPQARGTVYLFENKNDEWLPYGAGEIKERRDFGTSISLNAKGDAIAISNPKFTLNSVTHVGAVEVWRIEKDTFAQIGTTIYGSREFEKLGSAISLSDDARVLAVGIPDYVERGVMSGALQVYEISGSRWQPTSRVILGDDDEDMFGFSVAVNASGNSVIVGAPGKDYEFRDHGQAKVYEGFRLISSNNTLSIDELKVFPNPVSNRLQVEVPYSYKGDLSLSVQDLNGKVVLQRRFFEAQDVVAIDVSRLPSGIYTLTCLSEEEAVSGRVVIE